METGQGVIKETGQGGLLQKQCREGNEKKTE